MTYTPSNDLERALDWLMSPNSHPERWDAARATGMGDGEIERAIVTSSSPAADGENRHCVIETNGGFKAFLVRVRMADGRPELVYKETVLRTKFLCDRVREYLRIPRTEDLYQGRLF